MASKCMVHHILFIYYPLFYFIFILDSDVTGPS